MGERKETWNYKETATDLATRIAVHDLYGEKDIDDWILECAKIENGEKILDIGCGNGKQCFLFAGHFPNTKIIGIDISEELLNEAQVKAKEQGFKIKFFQWNMNRGMPFDHNVFDLVTCCFTIYYADDLDWIIREIHRILKPKGRVFLSGPTPENKKQFYQLHKEVSKAEIPYMPGRARFESEALTSVKRYFKNVNYLVFKNPLTFTEAEPFVQYYLSTISVDRQLWEKSFRNETHRIEIINLLRDKVKGIINSEGKFVMTKVVGGIIGYK